MKRLSTVTLLILLFCVASAQAQRIDVTGKVLLQNGAPAAQAVVEFIGGEGARATTSSDGSYYVSSLAKGSYTVEITYRGKTTRQQVAVTQRTLNLTIN